MMFFTRTNIIFLALCSVNRKVGCNDRATSRNNGSTVSHGGGRRRFQENRSILHTWNVLHSFPRQTPYYVSRRMREGGRQGGGEEQPYFKVSIAKIVAARASRSKGRRGGAARTPREAH